MLDKIYASATGLAGGMIAFINNLDEQMNTLIIKTVILAALSSLAGQIVKDVYLVIRHTLKSKK